MSQGKDRFCLWGYSGHAYVIAESIKRNGHELICYIDLRESLKNPFKLQRFSEDLIADFYNENGYVIVFPSVGLPHIRREMVSRIRSLSGLEGRVVDPTVSISTGVDIGLSTFVGARAVINPCAQIGEGSIVNTAAVIEHECIVGDFTHIGPGAVLAGNVHIGSDSFVGANVTIKQGVKVGSRVTIGAGAVVIKDIPDDGTWVGSPVRRIK